MSDDAIETVMLRNSFYRDNYRRVVTALLAMIVINFCLLGLLAWVKTHPPQPQYFATTNDGTILPLTPLDQPNLPKAAILTWATAAATAAYNYNYVDYRKQLQEAADYFTPEGWQQFLSQLSSSNNLNAVRTRRLVVSAVPTAAPVILTEGVINGRYRWRIELPILVTYQGAGYTTRQALSVVMDIIRVPTLNNPRGIGVAQFVAVQGSSAEGNN